MRHVIVCQRTDAKFYDYLAISHRRYSATFERSSNPPACAQPHALSMLNLTVNPETLGPEAAQAAQATQAGSPNRMPTPAMACTAAGPHRRAISSPVDAAW